MMNKKILWIIATAISLLIFNPFCYAQNKNSAKLVEPHPDGMYQLKHATIKFFPPDTWRQFKLRYPYPLGVNFMYNETTRAIVGIDVYSNGSSIEELKEKARGVMGWEDMILEEQDIYFLDVKAYSVTTVNKARLKHKIITFYKGNKWWFIIFTAHEEHFDKLLPAVDESLKSLEIVEIKEE